MVQRPILFEWMKRDEKLRGSLVVGLRAGTKSRFRVRSAGFCESRDRFLGAGGLWHREGVEFEVWSGEKNSGSDISIVGIIWRKFN